MDTSLTCLNRFFSAFSGASGGEYTGEHYTYDKGSGYTPYRGTCAIIFSRILTIKEIRTYTSKYSAGLEYVYFEYITSSSDATWKTLPVSYDYDTSGNIYYTVNGGQGTKIYSIRPHVTKNITAFMNYSFDVYGDSIDIGVSLNNYIQVQSRTNTTVSRNTDGSFRMVSTGDIDETKAICFTWDKEKVAPKYITIKSATAVVLASTVHQMRTMYQKSEADDPIEYDYRLSIPDNSTVVMSFPYNSTYYSALFQIPSTTGSTGFGVGDTITSINFYGEGETRPMPTKNSRVLFKAGLKANYTALATKDTNTVYFCTDSEQIFVGSSEYTKGGVILSAAPTATTAGDEGKLYAYNGNLYLCEGYVENEYKYTRVANINDVVGSVTNVATGDGLTGGPITSTGTISHAVPTGAAETTIASQTLTPAFGGDVTLTLVSATDKFGHVTGTADTKITLPTETELSRTATEGTKQTPGYGDTITVVTDVEVANGQVVKPKLTEIQLPASDSTTYSFASTSEGKFTVTPTPGTAYDVSINGWSDLAKKSELAAVFKFKGTVDTVDDLPKTAEVGDVYHVNEASAEYVCVTASTETTDAVYEELGSVIDLSKYALSADVIQRVKNADRMIPQFTADGTLSSTGKQTSDFVEKTTTIAGIDLQDNITATELNTALGVSDKIRAEAKDATYKTTTVESETVTTSIAQALDDIYSQIGEGGSVQAQIKAAIEELDATVTNGVETGTQPDVVVTVTETDGKLTAVTANVTAERFDAYGAAKAVADTLGTAAAANVSTNGPSDNDGTLPTAAQVKSYVDAAIAWDTF